LAGWRIDKLRRESFRILSQVGIHAAKGFRWHQARGLSVVQSLKVRAGEQSQNSAGIVVLPALLATADEVIE